MMAIWLLIYGIIHFSRMWLKYSHQLNSGGFPSIFFAEMMQHPSQGKDLLKPTKNTNTYFAVLRENVDTIRISKFWQNITFFYNHEHKIGTPVFCFKFCQYWQFSSTKNQTNQFHLFEAEIPTPLLILGERKCLPHTSLVHLGCTISNEYDPKDGTNKKGIFGCGFVGANTPDQFTWCIWIASKYKTGILETKRNARIKSANQFCFLTGVTFETEIITIDYHAIKDQKSQICMFVGL